MSEQAQMGICGKSNQKSNQAPEKKWSQCSSTDCQVPCVIAHLLVVLKDKLLLFCKAPLCIRDHMKENRGACWTVCQRLV